MIARALAATTQGCDVDACSAPSWGQFISAGGETLCLAHYIEREHPRAPELPVALRQPDPPELPVAPLAQDPAAVERAMEHLGVPKALDRSFACVFVGHTGRASVRLDERAEIYKLRCWCHGGWWRLCDVWAAVVSKGEPTWLRDSAVWYRRLWFEAGLLALPAVPLGAPYDGARESLQRYRDGVELLIRVRWLERPGEPVALADEFMATWTGLSSRQARRAREEMSASVADGGLGLLVDGGRYPGRVRRRDREGCPLYLPSGEC